MTRWSQVAVGSVCEIVKGGVDPQRHPSELFAHYSIPALDEGDGPAIEVGEAIKSQKTAIENGVVLVSKLNPRIPRVWLVDDVQAYRRICSTEFVPLKPDPARLDLEYLAFAMHFALAAGQINGRTSAATKSRERAKPNDFLLLSLPLPPLPEQRRLVDILTRAEGIVRLHRESLAKTRELIPALFLDLFGDPATNPKGWPLERFGEVGILDRGRSRHRPRDAKELYGGPYPFIQTGDVSNSGGRITEFNTTYSESGLAQSRLWAKGTLCITIAANIAKTGVLDFDACFPDSVVGFMPGVRVRTDYVQAWLGFLQPTLEANAPQAAQKNINLEILRNLPVPVPPLAMQEAFEQRCQGVFGIQSQTTTALAAAEATFQSLLHRAFQTTPDANGRPAAILTVNT